MIANRLDFAVEAERAGIAHYHVTEHHGTPLSVCPSPNLFLAALSQRTTTMRIGALVHVLPMYEPLRLAEEIAVLDQLTGGRLDIGVGSGVSPYELGYFGIDAAQARARYAETLKAVTQALTTGRMRHTGHAAARLRRRAVGRPGAAAAPAAVVRLVQHRHRRVGRRERRQLRRPVERRRLHPRRPRLLGRLAARQTRRVARGAIPRIGTAAHVYIGRTDDEAVERFRKANDVFARQLHKLWHDNGNHGADHFYDTDKTMANGNSLVGSAETVAAKLAAQVSQAPVNYFEATLAFGDLTVAEATANLTAFAETVMPAVRAAFAAGAAEDGVMAELPPFIRDDAVRRRRLQVQETADPLAPAGHRAGSSTAPT